MTSLLEYKDYIIFGGLGLGLLHIFDVLPLEISPIGDKIKYIYMAAIILAIYCHYTFNYTKSIYHYFQRTVKPRSLMTSSPQFRQKMASQRGPVMPRNRVPQYAQQYPTQPTSPSHDIFRKFQ